MEQTSNEGSYTQVWTVGNVTASPALTYIVGELGSPATVVSTDTGMTSDGNLEGFSSLSITDGVVSTYSETYLDYTSSLYYDSNTVATLFDEHTQVGQSVSGIFGGNTIVTMTANTTAWHDYDLQTDHYAIAYLVSGSYYINPLYWGDSCYEDSGDCSIDSVGGDSGDYEYEITSEVIYMGSTLADQTYIPQDGSVPAFNDSVYDNFLASSAPPYPSNVSFKANVKQWFQQLSIFGAAVALRWKNHNYENTQGTNPIPFLVDLNPMPDGDSYQTDPTTLAGVRREREYTIKDILGRPWPSAPIAVRERFSDPIGPGASQMPPPNGYWYWNVTVPQTYVRLNTAKELYRDRQNNVDEVVDLLALGKQGEVGFVQYFYASDFSPPSWMSLPSGFSLPGISATGLVVPLWIKDSYNKCSGPIFVAGQAVRLNASYAGLSGDMGPGTGCAPGTH